ncbi:hypothetical protein CJF31_00008164 [Rutstroemia sp. NJR-2017a BVV2]|nr:hypothetical protein CJF31_00008164 [Rutstroemia sp. NJR-2017a BVV2]
MSASQNQSSLNEAPNSTPAGTTFGANDAKPSSEAKPANTVGSATAMGHGDHPKDNADDSNAELSGSKYGVQKEDLEGEQMAVYAEGHAMHAQLDKKNAGWGEEGSFTSDLDRQKAEQKEARENIKAQREQGVNIDGGNGRLQNEGLGAV